MLNNPLPTAAHMAWQKAEMGVLIHFDIGIYEPNYFFRDRRGYVPPASMFNPVRLDTDQWVRAAVAAGAKYAVLVAKHCIGFTLWPSKAYPYGVAQSPWRGGKGDIVADFIASCKKYGVKPGLYCSTSCNAYWNVDNPGRELSGDAEKQERYNRAVEQMAEELWGNYGELFEIWFDGGVLPPEMGGPDLVDRLIRLQSGAVCFQGPGAFPTLIRWGTNEEGVAPDPCWMRTDMQQPKLGQGGQGECPLEGPGRPDGTVWAPVEADMTIRSFKAFGGGWFWKAGEDHLVFPVEHLMDRYEKTVGRGCNLMLGMVIDGQGLVPEKDVETLALFGQALEDTWGAPAAKAAGSGNNVTLALPQGAVIDRAMIQEDLSGGQHIRRWTLEAVCGGSKKPLAKGESLGNKRLCRFDAIKADALLLTLETDGESASILRLAAFAAN